MPLYQKILGACIRVINFSKQINETKFVFKFNLRIIFRRFFTYVIKTCVDNSLFITLPCEKQIEMNYLDIIILLFLLFSAINGLRNGFIAEVVSFASLIVGIWGAIKFSGITSEFLIENFNMKSEYLGIISFTVTFLLIVLLIYFVGNVVKKLVSSVLPGIIDHLVGLIFGIVKSALILSVVFIVFDKIDNSVHILSEDTKAESRLYEPVRSFAPSIFSFLEVWDNRENSSNSGNKLV